MEGGWESGELVTGPRLTLVWLWLWCLFLFCKMGTLYLPEITHSEPAKMIVRFWKCWKFCFGSQWLKAHCSFDSQVEREGRAETGWHRSWVSPVWGDRLGADPAVSLSRDLRFLTRAGSWWTGAEAGTGHFADAFQDSPLPHCRQLPRVTDLSLYLFILIHLLYPFLGLLGVWAADWKWKVKVLVAHDPVPAACQTPLSTEFSRPEYWSGLLFPDPGTELLRTVLNGWVSSQTPRISWILGVGWGRGCKGGRGFQGSREHPFRGLFPVGRRLPASPSFLPPLTPQLSTLSRWRGQGAGVTRTGSFIVKGCNPGNPLLSELPDRLHHL